MSLWVEVPVSIRRAYAVEIAEGESAVVAVNKVLAELAGEEVDVDPLDISFADDPVEAAKILGAADGVLPIQRD